MLTLSSENREGVDKRRRAGKESDEKRGGCSERVRRVGMDC